METGELSAYLSALGEVDSYRVDALLKESSQETTQRVYFVGSDGSSLGPFVRKLIAAESGLGAAYEELFRAQRAGVRFVHLPHILECRRGPRGLVVVMEHVAGESLERRVLDQGSTASRLALARTVFPQVCDAVTELHERMASPIIHRDLKPSNVMVGPRGDVTLIDLGISRVFHDGAECDTTHFGTRAYASPEQYGFGQTTVRSDIYSLGMLLFFCVTGRDPEQTDRASGFAACGRLAGVVGHAAALDPDARPASVRELRREFLEAVPESAAQVAAGAPKPPVTREPSAPAPPSLASRLLARVPAPVGVVWNVMVLLAIAIMVYGCLTAFAQARGANALYPLWFRVSSYLIFLPVSIMAMGYLMLDRRRIRARMGWTARQEWSVCGVAILGGVALFVIGAMAVGPVG